ncbi:hypothetical protein M9435_001790 [Picochlorum sp. BPE23]|nr:hypothetical protein M9435_001790 [Picochlorum sp. BPE23]
MLSCGVSTRAGVGLRAEGEATRPALGASRGSSSLVLPRHGLCLGRQRRSTVKAGYRQSSVYGQSGLVRLEVGDGQQHGVSVVIPLNYAQMLGLKGRDLYLDPIINTAYDDLFHQALNPGYSAIAKLGKEKLLFAAREALRSVKGRVSLVHPDVTVEPVLLPGTMALLNQLGHYELVVQLAEQVKNISTRDLKATNKGTLREYKRDVALAAALANCGLARDALEGGSVSLGYARLEEAATIMDTNGGKSLSSDLYSDISQALVDLRSDAVVDTLREPLDLGQVTNRQGAIKAFVDMLKSSSVTEEFVSRVLGYMTSIEIVEAMDWIKMASDSNKEAWWTAQVAMNVALAHMVAGFAYRRPYLVAKARRLFGAAHNKQGDVAVPLAVCEILLGETSTAISLLIEDERLGAKLRGAAHMAGSGANSKVYPADVLPERDDVMGYIRYNSPSSNDVLPGLCLFVQLWLSTVAFPRSRDTKERPVSPSLGDYFEAPSTVKYLTSKSKGLKEALIALWGQQVKQFKSSVDVARQYMNTLSTNRAMQKTVFNVVAVITGVYVVSQIAAFRPRVSPGRDALAEKTSSSAAVKKKTKKQKKKASTLENNKEAPLTKQEVKNIVESWLDIKAEAMGPRHYTKDLADTLAEPMLSAVASEAKEASKSGWFWNIKPLRVRIDSVSNQKDGSILAVAVVDENADLWATNGKMGDSYRTSYKVEYTLVQQGASWKISSALVVGK